MPLTPLLKVRGRTASAIPAFVETRCDQGDAGKAEYANPPGHYLPSGDMVGKGRLELPRLSAHDPKSCSSTNSDTPPSVVASAPQEGILNDTPNQADLTNLRALPI